MERVESEITKEKIESGRQAHLRENQTLNVVMLVFCGCFQIINAHTSIMKTNKTRKTIDDTAANWLSNVKIRQTPIIRHTLKQTLFLEVFGRLSVLKITYRLSVLLCSLVLR